MIPSTVKSNSAQESFCSILYVHIKQTTHTMEFATCTKFKLILLHFGHFTLNNIAILKQNSKDNPVQHNNSQTELDSYTIDIQSSLYI